MGSQWQTATDRLEVPGTVSRRGEGIKRMYGKSEIASNPDRFELGKSEKKSQKSETNSDLRLFYFCALCIYFSIT